MLGNYVLNILYSCIFIVLLLKIMGAYGLFDAITTGLMAISIYLAIEFINVKILQMVTGIEPINLSEDLRLRLSWFMPQLLVTGGLSFIIRYFVNSRSMNKLRNRGNDHENQYL
jgi:Mg2+/Co2+ transporter CorB